MMKLFLLEAFLFFPGVLLLILSFTGCDLYATRREFLVEIPEQPPIWKDLPLEGTLQTVCGEVPPLRCFPGETLTVSWPKGSPGILIYFLRTQGQELKPAGGFFPLGETGQPVKLTWKEGWLAEAVMTAMKDRGSVPSLNWERIRDLFHREVQDMSPWFLDQEQFLISWEKGYWGSGTFRPCNLEGTWEIPPGSWFPDDPCQRVITGPGKITVFLREGTNLWFFQDRILAVRAWPGGGQDWGVFSTLREPSEPAM